MVSDIQSEELETPEKVYNFEVADWHTYYVSEFGVLVHNKGSNSCGDELVEGMGEAGFKTQDLLDEHYDKHVIKQGEFGNITKNEYLEGAQKLVTSAQVEIYLLKHVQMVIQSSIIRLQMSLLSLIKVVV